MRSHVLQFIGNLNQGGTERQALALSAALSHYDQHRISIATLDSDGVLRPDAEAIAGPVTEFRLNSFYDLNFLQQVKRCSKWLWESKIELIHTHDFYSNIFGMTAATLAGVRVRIASKRETGGMRTPMQDRIEAAVFSGADAIVVNADAVREHLVSRGIDASKIVVIHNGIDLDRFAATADRDEVRHRYGIPTTRPLVTLVANLRHAVKNVPMLLRAATDVDTEFAIAGEGELMTELQGLAGELGVAGRVHFIGRCTDVPSLLAASDIGVLTSDNEGFSNAILEYMAAALPVVATDVGGAREAIIDGETGYVVPPNDSNELAAKLNDLLDDDAKSCQFGDAARRRVEERFSRKAQLAATFELYERLLAEKS